MDPCDKVRQEFFDAMNAWIDASNVLQSFAATRPLEPGQEPVQLPPLDEFREAFEREKRSQELYRQKMEEYFDCLERHAKQP